MSTASSYRARARPLGGVNFNVLAKDAVLLELLLFDDTNAIRPAKVIPLNADRCRIHHFGLAREGSTGSVPQMERYR